MYVYKLDQFTGSVLNPPYNCYNYTMTVFNSKVCKNVLESL